MKSQVIGLITSALIAGSAVAQSQQTVTYAQVIDSRPVYRTIEHVVPQQQCWVESVRTRQSSPSSASSTIAGGVLGGTIGHAVGRGKSNKKMGAAVGAVLGAAVGNDIARNSRANPSQVRHREVERCEYIERVESRRELVGYDVTYRYHGQNFTARTAHHPGNKLPVRVQVTPILN